MRLAEQSQLDPQDNKGTAYVWAELEVRDTSLNLLLVWVVQMTVNDLFGQCQRSVKPVICQMRNVHKGSLGG